MYEIPIHPYPYPDHFVVSNKTSVANTITIIECNIISRFFFFLFDCNATEKWKIKT